MAWPRSGKKQSVGHGRSHGSSNRLTQLLVGVVTVVVLVVGGFFYMSRASSEAPAAADREPLVANALNTAREVGKFIQESVSRDVATLADMLRRSDDDDDAEGEDADGSTDGETDSVAEVVLPPRHRLTKAQRMARLERMAPTLTSDVGRLDWAAVPIEPALFRVFDESDIDVVPPGTKDIRLRDDLLASWASDFEGELGADLQAEFEAGTREQIGMVEVVVSEYGKVERARLISNPSNVLDSMLLSAVKAWQFTPATRYEQAVRYRQVMPILVAR